jgi:CheY-like chemotaxis protein
MNKHHTILIAVPDLFFGVRIADTARALGFTPMDVTLEHLHEHTGDDVALIVVDIGQRAGWEGAIRALKRDPQTAAVPVLAFGAHVDVTASRAAVSAGCDRLVTRGKLMAEMPQLLQANARAASEAD